MLTIKDVKRKGELMILSIEDDSTPPKTFNLKIDAAVDEEMLWNHIHSHYEALLKAEVEPIVDEELEEKWKGKSKEVRK